MEIRDLVLYRKRNITYNIKRNDYLTEAQTVIPAKVYLPAGKRESIAEMWIPANPAAAGCGNDNIVKL